MNVFFSGKREVGSTGVEWRFLKIHCTVHVPEHFIATMEI